ncbi:hypothetical protein SLEP1_g17636 [Rubroshorea leprosula]|uniref:Uncharacterized protein n=1 Tax=Rubroshorea leprosula TaxID=152421 RepID=A0AAV5J5F2_9ROSI|nr:hypothetical protein SLEP1_g17636 [Rubroshorea leprosula]
MWWFLTAGIFKPQHHIILFQHYRKENDIVPKNQFTCTISLCIHVLELRSMSFMPGSLYAICRAHQDMVAFVDGVRGAMHAHNDLFIKGR